MDSWSVGRDDREVYQRPQTRAGKFPTHNAPAHTDKQTHAYTHAYILYSTWIHAYVYN